MLFIRLSILLFIVLAVSGTTLWYSGQGSNFDFVLAIDSSASMLVEDFIPNRLESAKLRAKEFLNIISPANKVGVVSFASTASAEQTLTNDFAKVKLAIDNMGVRKTGGTSLGEAIIASTNLLIESEASKAIVILTDGQGNIGLPVQEAVDYANSQLITIYTIGVGTEEGGGLGGTGAVLKLDEEGLKAIAATTGGSYYRTETEESLRQAYEEIASLTETKVSKKLSFTFMLLALIFLILEWMLFNTKYRTIP